VKKILILLFLVGLSGCGLAKSDQEILDIYRKQGYKDFVVEFKHSSGFFGSTYNGLHFYATKDGKRFYINHCVNLGADSWFIVDCEAE
jgi:hypothetical protein